MEQETGNDAAAVWAVLHRTYNESRVLLKHVGQWQIVHVHKSPAWSAAFEAK